MIDLGKYTFLPWVKKGLGNFTGIDDGYDSTSSTPERPNINIDLTLVDKDDTAFSDAFDKDFDLYGPGDVIGFSPKNVIKAYPFSGNFDFIPNYLPYIEFYDEDLPWRLTPAAKGSGSTIDRLTPWFFLVILKDDGSEFTLSTPNPEQFSVLTLKAGVLLPPREELGVFAHVHTNKGLAVDGASVKTALRNEMSSKPDNVISRIVSNRKLEENTRYQAFLIPTFETGKQIGINPSNDVSTIDSMQLAWDASGSPTSTNDFPIYYTWKFGAGEKGDFEKLAKDLEPRVLPPEIGVRDFDAQVGLEFSANFEENGAAGTFINNFQTKKLSIGGALKTTDTKFKGFDEHVYPDLDNPDTSIPKDPDIEQASFEEFMKNYLNLESVFMDLSADNKDFINKNISPDGDPVVTAPLYARWHASIDKIYETGSSTGTTLQWLKDLNLTPRNRATAGLGTDVIIDKQEEFMDDAWGQVGEVLEANRIIHQAQASVETSCKMHEQFKDMPAHRQLIVTAPMHKKVRS